MPTYQDLIGKQAPSFSLPNHDGSNFDFKPGEDSRPVALFFYPESGSYGCTRQACQFRDAVVENVTFSAEKVRLIGISPDSVEKQKQFVEKHNLPFPVLSDSEKQVAGIYHIPRGMMGITPVARVTVVIDAKGVVRDTLDATMNYGAHQKFVEKWLTKLENEAEPGAGTEAAPATSAES
ncbi:AhpC-TSA-domain-containing protein [Coprinopsis marcescibilis]|uniref:thioredoxin-dependent peroxiredoxin n=1 Tax=Coprinopsis marcescibilis TaxID=230819 RepID=A0A5C3L537_COPMA|nr:AhpC-TSA-domain-containing protein [Coprinopsis marcescibilis]